MDDAALVEVTHRWTTCAAGLGETSRHGARGSARAASGNGKGRHMLCSRRRLHLQAPEGESHCRRTAALQRDPLESFRYDAHPTAAASLLGCGRQQIAQKAAFPGWGTWAVRPTRAETATVTDGGRRGTTRSCRAGALSMIRFAQPWTGAADPAHPLPQTASQRSGWSRSEDQDYPDGAMADVGQRQQQVHADDQ